MEHPHSEPGNARRRDEQSHGDDEHARDDRHPRDPRDDDAPPAAKDPRSRRERLADWRRRHPRAAIALLVGLAALIVGGAWLGHYLATHESTDDAQVDGHIAAVSARITGNVIGVYADDHQIVKAGQLLVELDARDYQVAVARAEADLAQAEAQLEAAQPQVPITSESTQTRVSTSAEDILNANAAFASAQREYDAAVAAVRQAEAEATRARADRGRYQYLLEQRAIPRERWDQVIATARAADAAVDSASARAKAAQTAVAQQSARVAQAQSRSHEATRNAPRELYVQRANIAARQAAVRAAKAALERARLDLSYTRVVAPHDGVIGRRSVEPGNHVAPGEQLFAVVDTQGLYVTANFKETQLRKMRIGQRATVHVDAFKQDYDGWVDSFAGAAGARFSIFPPENATGNYVKVVQRIPVRIRIKPNQPGADRLRPGMSVEPKVFLK